MNGRRVWYAALALGTATAIGAVILSSGGEAWGTRAYLLLLPGLIALLITRFVIMARQARRERAASRSGRLFALLVSSTASAFYLGLTYDSFARAGALGTASYVALVPIALAAVPLVVDDASQVLWSRIAILAPLLGLAIAVPSALLLQLEGLLCALVLAGLMLPVLVIGFFVVKALYDWLSGPRDRQGMGVLLLFLPFAGEALESRFPALREHGEVSESLIVLASPETVWSHVVEVAPLQEHELPRGPLQRLGVPRPVSATVSKHEAGALRTGLFENGLRLFEPIERYDRPRELRLRVQADLSTAAGDPSLEHALAAGYFRIEQVRYRIEQLGPQRVRLTLSCGYSLRSHLSFYGHPWVRLIFGDFERGLLRALAARAERDERAGRSLALGR